MTNAVVTADIVDAAAVVAAAVDVDDDDDDDRECEHVHERDHLHYHVHHRPSQSESLNESHISIKQHQRTLVTAAHSLLSPRSSASP